MCSISPAISLAFALSTASSGEKTLTSIGAGDQVRSPMRSLRIPANSTWRTGCEAWIFSLSSSVTCSTERLRSCLSFTRKSPVFGSEMASARRAPVRRE